MTLSIVSLSGGIDSATVLAEVIHTSHSVEAVGFCYGAKHNEYENKAALALASHYGVCFQVIDISSIVSNFRSNLLMTGGDIPEGHQQAPSMSQTVVPARNIIFVSILAGIAWSRNADFVWFGIHAGDHHIYPDCRPSFFRSMNNAIREGTDDRVRLQAPFIDWTKAKVVQRGLELNVPYELTRTCYKDQPVACGKCGSCVERLEAFSLNGKSDPVEYEGVEDGD